MFPRASSFALAASLACGVAYAQDSKSEAEKAKAELQKTEAAIKAECRGQVFSDIPIGDVRSS